MLITYIVCKQLVIRLPCLPEYNPDEQGNVSNVTASIEVTVTCAFASVFERLQRAQGPKYDRVAEGIYSRNAVLPFGA